MDRTTGQKISKEIENLNNTTNQLEQRDIYRTLHSRAVKYTFFKCTWNSLWDRAYVKLQNKCQVKDWSHSKVPNLFVGKLVLFNVLLGTRLPQQGGEQGQASKASSAAPHQLPSLVFPSEPLSPLPASLEKILSTEVVPSSKKVRDLDSKHVLWSQWDEIRNQ